MSDLSRYETGNLIVNGITSNKTGMLRIDGFEDVDSLINDLSGVELLFKNNQIERAYVEIKPSGRRYVFMNIGEVQSFMLGVDFSETDIEASS
jgi:hypothetical protein